MVTISLVVRAILDVIAVIDLEADVSQKYPALSRHKPLSQAESQVGELI